MRAVALFLIGALLLLGGTSTFSGVAATSTVPGSSSGTVSSAITAEDLKPASCAGITLTAVVSGTGVFGGGVAAELITGSAAADTISGGGGTDCILGGDSGDTINGDAGADVLREIALEQMRDAASEFRHLQAAADRALGVGQHLAVLARHDLGHAVDVGFEQLLEFEDDVEAWSERWKVWVVVEDDWPV